MKMTEIVVTSINTCSDTDNGKNYREKGSVFGAYYFFIGDKSFVENYSFTKDPYFHEEDECKNKNILTECYCVNDGIHSYKEKTEYRCVKGCEEGRCLGEVVLEEITETPNKVFWKRLNGFLRDFWNSLRIQVASIIPLPCLRQSSSLYY